MQNGGKKRLEAEKEGWKEEENWSQGTEVKEESYDEHVFSMKRSKAIN